MVNVYGRTAVKVAMRSEMAKPKIQDECMLGCCSQPSKPLQSVYLCADLSIVFLLSFGAWRNAALRKKLLLDVGRLLSQDFVFIMNSFLEWLFADNRSTSGNDSYRQVT